VVTHLTTNPPVSCLTRAERTGSRGFKILWSYVQKAVILLIIYQRQKQKQKRDGNDTVKEERYREGTIEQEGDRNGIFELAIEEEEEEANM
jgi:hypothetical protein